MSNDLVVIVDRIKFLKKWTVEEVAKSIKYSRIHLQKEMKKPNGNAQLVRLLKEKHAALLNNQLDDSGEVYGKVTLRDKVTAHDALFAVLVPEIAALISRQTGEPVQALIKKLYKAAEDVNDDLIG